MKTGEVARMLNVSRKTVANWTLIPELKKFFSEGALRGADEGTTSQRDFDEADLVVLNTIRLKKTRTNSWSDVARMLESGEREAELPPSALLVETLSPVEQMQVLLNARKNLELAQQRIDDLEIQLEFEREFRKEERETFEARHREDRERWQQEVVKLNREIAVLQYRLERREEDE